MMEPIVDLIVPAFGALLAVVLFGRFRPLGAAGHVDGPPHGRRVVVVIPARNEEHSLPRLLDDLAMSALRPEVVVVDDASVDGTRAVAEGRAEVTVVSAPALPSGWCGKNWACDVGVRAAAPSDDDVLVFLDADVGVSPRALGRLVDARESLGGVVSVQPHHEVPSAVEQLSGLFNLVSIMGIAAGTSHPTGMFGPVICCTAGDYRAVDGHRGVRSELVEDLALARQFRSAGIGITVAAGGDDVSFRMYPLGFTQLWEGWSKNVATGAASVPLLRSAGVACWIASLLSAVMQLFGGGLPAVGGAAVAALTTSVLLRRVGTYRWWAGPAFGVLVAFFVVVFTWSALGTFVRRRVTWKGRTIGT